MNKVFLIGNLSKDPELTETKSGVSICRFNIAVNRNYSGADGERKTDFFNCVAWRGLGETVARYAQKGNKIAVSGSIELRNFEDSKGVKRTAIDIVAQDVEFLTPRQIEDDEDSGHLLKGAREPSDMPIASPGRKPVLQPFDDDGDIPF